MSSTPEQAVSSLDEEAGPGPRPVSVRCWGTRGSIPSPGPATAGYGGNTSCLEVQVGDERIIFDAGTGLRLLGDKIAATGDPVRATIFLTHFHWDHIQGFPFFAPLYDPAARLRLIGPPQKDLDIQTLFARQMGPVYFPVPLEALAAELTFDPLSDDAWESENGIRIRSMRVRHPSNTVGYRLEAGDRSVCYVPDNELEGSGHPTGPGWRERFLEFIEGTDVLFHDAMYTEEEYEKRTGWGHSTYQQTAELATEAGVGQLFFFHHAPERSDAELNPILDDFRSRASRRGLSLEVNAAFEGKEIRIEET